MHLLFRTYDCGCRCIDATDEDGKTMDEYIGKTFADVMDDYGVFVDESMKYFLAETSTHAFKCRFWGNKIILYITPLTL